MSNRNQFENATGVEDELDFELDFLEDMREYHAPGGLYEQQRERDANSRALPPLESYERVNS